MFGRVRVVGGYPPNANHSKAGHIVGRNRTLETALLLDLWLRNEALLGCAIYIPIAERPTDEYSAADALTTQSFQFTVNA